MTLIEDLKTILGDRAVACDAAEGERRGRDYFNSGVAPALAVYPTSTEEVSRVLALCNARGQAVVPQGGLSGLSGGAVPLSHDVVALSFDRMRAIEEIDLDAQTITVQAGAVLQTVQEAAEARGMLFPLDLGGRGSAQVGGLIGTNAGGNRVLRYGMMRDLVLGLEAVLPDGRVISSLNTMLKNNTGYDLKQLFVGSEGTLGVVTRANLKIFPMPSNAATALCGLPSYEAALALLRRARSMLGGTLSAFEAMWPDFYDLAMTDQARAPLQGRHNFYVLLDALGSDAGRDGERFEAMIGEALEAGEVEDAVIAQSTQQTRDLWKIRELPTEYSRLFWPQLSFDVSAPTGEIGGFRDDVEARLKARFPRMPTIYFGHVADANLHMSLKTAEGEDHEAIKAVVYEAVRDWKGSVSAEHGIGTEKRKYLSYSRTAQEIGLMGELKRLLDPNGILNPGKVLGG